MYLEEQKGIQEVSRIVFPLVVVLTQDCDLQWDYQARWSSRRPKDDDKKLISVLVAPLYNADHVFMGEHLSEIGMTMRTISRKKTPGQNLERNETPRYHYLAFDPSAAIPSSVIDFKHYFSVNVNYLKKHRRENFVCRLPPLYREDVSKRFAEFLSRIALPEP